MSDEEYSDQFVAGLEWIWGEGFLSPGGPAEVAEILDGVELNGKKGLDIGCGLGGIDLLLVADYGADFVQGIDVEAPLIERAAIAASRAGLTSQLDFKLVTPGALPFRDDEFDFVFSKDSMIHIPDKPACYQEIRRVLKPSGQLVFSDWFGSADPMTDAMTRWLEVVGLTFELGTMGQAVDILSSLGFDAVEARDRNHWYRQYMDEELATLSGEHYTKLVSEIGKDAAAQRLESSSLKKTVVEQGQLRPGHIRARLQEIG
ncbi:MAG: methyltransferase domain-containing protein [Gammaproteobacteria bacterium]|nr:methyltransferase domain-containing protein [Gammaproteobacteria bacterium]